MKHLNSYSKKKFQSLSHTGQIHAINALSTALEESFEDTTLRKQYRDHILECISWMDVPLQDNVKQLALALHDQSSPHALSDAIARFRLSQGFTFTDTQLSIRKGDGQRNADPVMRERSQKVIVILDNLRSVFNIGSIFRTSECLALCEIWLCGISATPENPALHKTAMGTSEHVTWRHFPETQEAIRTAKAEGYCVYALETTQDSRSVFNTEFCLPLALVLGNESLGLAPETLALCDYHISLPVQGWKNSLNVAVAFAICAYQIVFASSNTYQPTR